MPRDKKERALIAKIRASDPCPVRLLASPIDEPKSLHLGGRTMVYSKEEIVKMVTIALETPEKAYRRGVWNYRGPRSGERYTEMAARELLKDENFSKLCSIRQISRENYKVAAHERLAKEKRPENTKQDEKWIAKGMYGKTLSVIGKVLDFETPLSRVDNDNAGEIDLLSHNENSGETYLLELKKPSSKETLLRCVLEIFTYWKVLDHEKFLHDFGLPQDTIIKKAVFVFEESVQHNEYRKGSPYTKELMKALDVDIFLLRNSGENHFEVLLP